MNPLQELLAVDERRALEFFVLGLQDVSEANVDRQELLYNASLLAHYAQVSTQFGVEMPAPAALGDVFDQFVLDSSLYADGQMMETAGAQCLLLAGFFEDQVRRRHNIRWYTELGAGFFSRAASQADSRRRHASSTRWPIASSRGAGAMRASVASCATGRTCCRLTRLRRCSRNSSS